MVVKIPSLSRYSTLLHIEKCRTKKRMTTVERMGRENPQFVTVFYTSTHREV